MAPFLLSLLLVIAGCAPAPPVPDETLFKTWQGKPQDELIAAFGPPTSERPSDSGGTVLIWKKAEREHFTAVTIRRDLHAIDRIVLGLTVVIPDATNSPIPKNPARGEVKMELLA